MACPWRWSCWEAIWPRPERSLFPDLSEAAFAELDDPAARLRLAGRRLGATGTCEQTLHETIALSIDALTDEHPPAADVFHALGVFAPKPAGFDRPAAEAITGADDRAGPSGQPQSAAS